MRLALLTPDSSREAEVRAACLRRLGQARRRSARRAVVVHAGRAIIAPLVTLLGAAYVVTLIILTLQTLVHLK